MSPKYFLFAALLLVSVFRFLPDLCIVASSSTRLLDVVAVEFSSMVWVALCSSALLSFSANLRSFSANLRAFASATFFAFSAFSSAAFLAFSAFSANFRFLSSAFLCFSSSAFFFFSSLVSFVVLPLLQPSSSFPSL